MNPFDKSFQAQYELARRIGDKRFGTECKHERIVNGRCANCQRLVTEKRRRSATQKGKR